MTGRSVCFCFCFCCNTQTLPIWALCWGAMYLGHIVHDKSGEDIIQCRIKTVGTHYGNAISLNLCLNVSTEGAVTMLSGSWFHRGMVRWINRFWYAWILACLWWNVREFADLVCWWGLDSGWYSGGMATWPSTILNKAVRDTRFRRSSSVSHPSEEISWLTLSGALRRCGRRVTKRAATR